jgi:hypothetical protein
MPRCHVSHLVHIDGCDQADGEWPAEHGPVDADGGQHRQRGRRVGEPQGQQLALGEHEREDGLELPGNQTQAGHCARRPGGSRVTSGCVDEAGAQMVDARTDVTMLLCAVRQEHHRLAPRRQLGARVAGDGRRTGLARKRFQPLGMNQRLTRRTRQQRRRDRQRARGTRHRALTGPRTVMEERSSR